VSAEVSVSVTPEVQVEVPALEATEMTVSMSKGDGLGDGFSPWFGDGLTEAKGGLEEASETHEGQGQGEDDLLLSLQEEGSQSQFLELHLLAPGDPGIGFGGQRDQHQDDGGHDEEKSSGPHFVKKC